MSKLPSMPLFVDAYLADTAHLSIEESGAYLHLLMAMWRHNGFIPDDDKDNARMCKVGRKKWAKLKARLAPLLLFSGGRISQKRLQKEWNYTLENSDRQRQKSIRSWDIRRQRKQTLNSSRGISAAEAEPHAETVNGISPAEAPIPNINNNRLLASLERLEAAPPFLPKVYRKKGYA